MLHTRDNEEKNVHDISGYQPQPDTVLAAPGGPHCIGIGRPMLVAKQCYAKGDHDNANAATRT